MRRTIKLVAILAIMLIALSGCVSIDYGAKINRNGSADVDYTLQYNVEDLASIGITASKLTDSLEQQADDAKENGYDAEVISNDKNVGINMKKHFEKASDISIGSTIGEDYIVDKGSDSIKIDKGLFFTKYSLDTKIDLTSMSYTDEETMNYMGKTVDELFDVKVKFTVPGITGDNNATNKNGKTLEWKLKLGDENQIKFESKVITPIAMIIIIVVAGVVIGGIFIIIKKVNKGTKEIGKEDKDLKAEIAKATAIAEQAESKQEVKTEKEVKNKKEVKTEKEVKNKKEVKIKKEQKPKETKVKKEETVENKKDDKLENKKDDEVEK